MKTKNVNISYLIIFTIFILISINVNAFTNFYIDSINSTYLSGWEEGCTYTVRVVDTLLFVGNGKFIDVYSINDTSNIYKINSIKTYGPVIDFQVDDTLIYIANELRGLTVINISDIDNPIIISNFDDSDGLYDSKYKGIEIRDSFAYIASSGEGLKIINIADPTNPILNGYIDRYTINIENSGLSISSSMLCAGNELYFITDPANPVYINSVNGSKGIFYQDTLLFASYNNAIYIYNVKDPLNITTINSYNCNSNIGDFYILDTILFIADSLNVSLINISNIDSLILIDLLSITDKRIGIYANNNILYVSGELKGLNLIDYSDPNNIYLFHNITTYSYIVEEEIVNDTLLFSAGHNSMNILNISNNDSIFLISNYQNNEYVQSICVNYPYCFLGTTNGFDIVNINNINNPVSVYFDSIGNVYSIRVQDSILIVSCDTNIIFYNISNIASPSLISSIDTLSEISWDMEINNTILYTSKYVIDFSDILNPYVMSVFTNSNYYISLEDSLMIGANNENIWVYKISNPESISINQIYEFADYDFISDVFYDGRIIFISWMGAGVSACTWNDTLKILTSYFTSDYGKSIMVKDSTIYAGGYYTGVQAIQAYDFTSNIKKNMNNKNMIINFNSINNDVLSFEVQLSENILSNISIYNVLGEKVYNKNIILHNGKNTLKINDLKCGIYFIKLGTVVAKVAKLE